MRRGDRRRLRSSSPSPSDRPEGARSVPDFIAGQLVFDRETIAIRLLHNEVAFAVQRRLVFHGYDMVVLPVQVPEEYMISLATGRGRGGRKGAAVRVRRIVFTRTPVRRKHPWRRRGTVDRTDTKTPGAFPATPTSTHCSASARPQAERPLLDPAFDLSDLLMVHLMGVFFVARYLGRGPSILA